jgi:hypothetical protein
VQTGLGNSEFVISVFFVIKYILITLSAPVDFTSHPPCMGYCSPKPVDVVQLLQFSPPIPSAHSQR